MKYFSLTFLILGAFAFPLIRAHGECLDAPQNLHPRGVQGPKTISMTWDTYDFSECGVSTTYQYEIKIQTEDGVLVKTYTKTRKNRFVLPRRTLDSGYKTIGYHRDLLAKVRAIDNEGNVSSWSESFVFSTPPPRPNKLRYSLGEDSDGDGLWSIRVSWKNNAADDSGFLQYAFVITETNSEAVSAQEYVKTNTELVSKNIDAQDTKRTSWESKEILRLFEDASMEPPYTQYIYVIQLWSEFEDNDDAENSVMSSIRESESFGIVNEQLREKHIRR